MFYIINILIFLIITSTSFTQEYWIRQNSPTDNWLTRIQFTDTLHGWASGDSGTVIHTTDGGQNWDRQYTGLAIYIDDIFFINRRIGWGIANDFYLYGTRILKTTNGGVNWNVSVFPDTTVILNTVYFIDSLTGFLGGFSGVNFKTTDAGNSWFSVRIDTNYCPALYLFPKTHFSFANAQTGFAAGGHFDIQGIIWKTTDSGLNWETYCLTPEPFRRIKVLSPEKIITTGGDFEYGVNIVQSLDGGNTWLYDTSVHLFGIGQALAFRTPAELWIPTGYGQSWILSLDSGGFGKPLYEIPIGDSTSVFDAVFVTPEFGWACGTYGALLKYNTAVIGIYPNEKKLPLESSLYQNYPNPFNPLTTIKYYLDKPSMVYLKIFDIAGREVVGSHEGAKQAGIHKYIFSAKNFASGIYFYQIQAGNFIQTKKMVILK